MSTTSDHDFFIDPDPMVSAMDLAQAANDSPQIIPCTNDPDSWLPERGEKVHMQKKLCLTECPIVLHCRAHALEHHEMAGIWGGLTYFERRNIWRRQHRDKMS